MWSHWTATNTAAATSRRNAPVAVTQVAPALDRSAGGPFGGTVGGP
jgi:hypothetical protein